MSQTAAATTPPGGRGPSPGAVVLARRIALWTLGAVVAAAALIAAALLFLDTGPGRGFVARQIGRLTLSSGLSIHIARIEGSIYGRMVLRGVTIDDARGPFVTSPAVVLDWRPAALLSKHVFLNEFSADLVRVLRRPALKPSANVRPGPLLPGVAITIRRLRMGEIRLEPAVTGQLRRMTVSGAADVVNRRAIVNLQADALATGGQAGGDHLTVRLDAEPDRNRLALGAQLHGPSGGIVAGLLNLKAPIDAQVSGAGDWKLWRGGAEVSLGGRPLLLAKLSEAGGVYAAQGSASPGLLLKGAIARLTAPSVGFQVTAASRRRLLQIQARLASPQMRVDLDGGVRLSDQSLKAMHVALQLPRPQAVSPSLTGSDLRLDLVLDGPALRPAVDYQLAARGLGWGKDTLEGVRAKGRIRLGTGRRLEVSVQGSADRMVAPGKLNGLIARVRLDGDVSGTWGDGVKGRITLASSALQARADISGSTATHRYFAVIKARLEAPAVQAFGLQPALEGPADLTARLSQAPGVTVQIESLELTSPGLRVSSASGVLKGSGAVSLNAQAVSARYGPAAVSVSGSLKAIRVHLLAARPDLGLKLTDLDATLVRAGAGYQVTATAKSPYGPLTANAEVTTGAGGISVNLQRGGLDGLNLQGRVTRTTAGPFAGALTLTGDGLDGALRLSASGAVQAADLHLRAEHARLPLAPPVTIASGLIDARAVLIPHAPDLTVRADLKGVRRNGLELASARAGLTYRNGAGRADLAARGTDPVPIEISSTASISPSAISVDAHGMADKVAFRLEHPAQIVRIGGALRLQPTAMLVSGGRVDASGSFGKGSSLSLRLQNVDLSVANVANPDLGLGGAASGAVDVTLPPGGGQPQARAQLQLTGVTRSGLTTVSRPVDVSLLGSLGAAGADLDAAVRRQGVVVGRLQTRLTAAAGGAGWMQRLENGRISGGVRYDGPAEALWALSGMSGQEVSGPIAIGADFSGQADAPQMRGVVHAQDLRYEDAKYGARIDNLAVQARFAGTRLELTSLTGKMGSGTVSAAGYVDLSLPAGLPVNLTVDLKHARLVSGDTLGAEATGQIKVTNSRQAGGLVAGMLTLDNARYAAGRQQAQAQVVDLQGVHFKGEALAPLNREKTLPISHWKLDLRIAADNQVFVTGMGLNSEWRADLRVTGDLHHPLLVGDITNIRGSYSFAGRQLQLTNGVIHLNGASPPDPTLNITASATVNSVTAAININGTAKEPIITFSSTPALPQDEVLARLLFGAATPQLSPIQAVQLAASLNALRGGRGLNPLGKLSRAIGVQNLTFSASGANGPSVGVGKYIGNRIYVEVTTDARGFAATQVQIALTKALNLLSQVSALGTSNLSLSYTHRY